MRPSLLLGALLAISPGAALAQTSSLSGVDAHGFALAPNDGDLKDYTSTWRAEAYEPMSFGIEGLFEYAYQPLVLFVKAGEGDAEKVPLVDHLVALNIGGFFAVHERVAIGLSAPVYLFTVTDQARGPALGDIRLTVPINLANLGDASKKGSVGFSVVPFAVLPTGGRTLLAQTQFGGGGLLAVSYNKGPFDLSANIGAQYRKRIDFQNLTGGPDLITAIAVAYELSDSLALRGEVNFHPNLLTADVETEGLGDAELPSQAIASVRGHLSDRIALTAGLGTALSRGVGAAPLRVFLGINGVFGKTHTKDRDGDGFSDKDDACPDDPETFNQYKDDDGCPDALATVQFEVVDPNGDPIPGVAVRIGDEEIGTTNSRGLVGVSDLMPGTSAGYTARHLKDGFQPAEGTIALAEGEQTQRVTMGWLPRPVRAVAVDADGAPVPATVSFSKGPGQQGPLALGDTGEAVVDLLPGSWSLKFTADGYDPVEVPLALKAGVGEERVEARMSPSRVVVTRTEVTIIEMIQFDFDKATIKPESARILDDIAKVLAENAQVKRVGVYGHTSDEGTDRYNLDLSQKRVQSVVDALVSRGIERSRLEPKGFGKAEPLVPNDSEANRAKNRRVQFMILEQE